MSYEEHKEMVKTYFSTDLNIDFKLSNDLGFALCNLESDAYYSKGERKKGDHRRFYIWTATHPDVERELHQFCNEYLTLNETLELLDNLEEMGYEIMAPPRSEVSAQHRGELSWRNRI